MNKASEAQRKYDDAHTRRYQLKLNLGTDSDIIARLDKADSIQGYIKELIRKDIELDKGIHEVYSMTDTGIEDINAQLEKGRDVFYEQTYTTESAGEMLRKLDEIKATDDEVAIECYRVNEDGDFVDGSDFDTPSNFRKRMALHI